MNTKSEELLEIEKIAQGNDAVRKRLLELFVQQVTRQVSQMNYCVQNKDWVSLRKVMHALKSTFLYIRIESHIELIEQIMNTAGEINYTIEQMVHKLEMTCLRLIGEFTLEYEKEFGKLAV